MSTPSSHGSGPPGMGKGQGGGPSPSEIYFAMMYPMEYIFTFTGFVAFLSIIRLVVFFSSLATRRSASSQTDAEKFARGIRPTSSAGRGWAFLKSSTNIFLYRFSLPFQRFHGLNNAEALLVSAYLGGVLTWSIANTPNINNPQNWSNRAAIMSVVQIPFIVALSGKNSVISVLTGISHEKLNVIHRAAGRTCFVTAWLHVGAYLIKFINLGINPFEKLELQWGLVAISSLTLAVLLSVRIVRNAAYEVFLISHILFIFLFILAVIYHQPNPNLTEFMKQGFIFWGVDRAMRLARILYWKVYAKPIRAFSSEADYAPTVERLSGDTVRLTLRYRRMAKWSPGQHFFISAPGLTNFPWEAHPFSAASIPRQVTKSDKVEGRVSSEDGTSLEFIIRARGGFTKKLYKYAVEQEASRDKGHSFTVDGPYGEPPSLDGFDTAMLIAGGSGVSYTLSLFLGLIQKAQQSNIRMSRIIFVWVVRDPDHIDWIAEALHSALTSHSANPNRLDICIQIYITRNAINVLMPVPSAGSTNSYDTRNTAETKKTTLSNLRTEIVEMFSGAKGVDVKVVPERPDMRKVIEDELALSDGRKVSVDVSGPRPLSETVKRVLATSSWASPKTALRGGPSVTLHSETFGW